MRWLGRNAEMPFCVAAGPVGGLSATLSRSASSAGQAVVPWHRRTVIQRRSQAKPWLRGDVAQYSECRYSGFRPRAPLMNVGRRVGIILWTKPVFTAQHAAGGARIGIILRVQFRPVGGRTASRAGTSAINGESVPADDVRQPDTGQDQACPRREVKAPETTCSHSEPLLD